MSSCEKKNTCEEKECEMLRQSGRIEEITLIQTTFDVDLTHLYQLVYFLLPIKAVTCLFSRKCWQICNEIRIFVLIFTFLDVGVFAL